MSAFKEVEKIDVNIKHSVNGFLKAIRVTLPDEIYYDIPALVYHWCLLYLYIKEYFDYDFTHSSYNIFAEATVIEKNKQVPGISCLKQIVKSGVHRWKFKYSPDGVHSKNTTLAVWKMNDDRNIDLARNIHAARSVGSLYGWVINYNYLTTGSRLISERKSYGQKKCRGGVHIIEMVLDLNEFTLRFIYNGTDLGIAFADIDKVSYRVVFGAFKKKDRLELLSYSNYYNTKH